MGALLRGIFSSKKFWYAVGSGAVAGGLNHIGVSQDYVNAVIALGGALILGQGMADFGKNK